jgi:hypothetical protein
VIRVLRIIFGLLLISFVSAANPYFVFQENGKSGLKNQEGKVLIPALYDAIGWSNGSFSLLNNVTGFRNGQGWGLINVGNQRVTKNEYTELYPAEGNFLIAGKLLKSSPRPAYGVINASGKSVIPFLYDGISIASLRAIVFTRIGNQFRYGLLDLDNKTIIPQQFQNIQSIGTLRYAVRNFEGKISVFSENGQQMTGFVIDSLSAYQNNLAIIYEGKYKGLIDRDGKIKLEAKFREIQLGDDNEIRVREADEWSFLNAENKLLRRIVADSVISIDDKLYKVSTSNQTQLVDENLSPVGNALLTDIRKFQFGKAVYQLGHLYGVLLRDGKVLVPALYHRIDMAKDYILASQQNGPMRSWILFDTLGNRQNTRAYESMYALRNGLFAVQHRGFFGIMNSAGKEVVACAYDSLLDVKDRYVVVKFKGHYGVINTSEEWLISPRTNKITLINENRFVEHTPTSAVLKERNGTVIYFSSNRIEIYADHLLEYLPSGTIWKIDMNGVIADRKVMPDEPTERVFEESEGYRAIKRNGRFGFIDSRGRLRIANRYEAVQPFSEGYAAIKILGKWGFINLQDNIAVQPVYEEVKSFARGHALVKQKGLFGLIDKRGKLVLPVRYEFIKVLSSGNFLIQLQGNKGMTDGNGKILIQPKYESLEDTGKGYAVVKKDSKFGVMNYNGVPAIPIMYDYIKYDPSVSLFIAKNKVEWQRIKL